MPGRDGKGPSWGNGPGRGKGKSRNSQRGIGLGFGHGMLQKEITESTIPDVFQPQSQPSSQQSISKEQELDLLKQQTQVLHRQADSILHRIEELNKGNQNVSKTASFIRISVIAEKCTGCEICRDVCRQNAITVNSVAEIDPEKCSGCGDCVDMCPNGALIFK